MTKLLALETSGTFCSVAIHADGVWIEDTQNVQRLHNQVLLQQIDGLARRAGIGPRGFDVIAFGAGPGSFTGVRIAAAAAQALALAGGVCVVPVSSSQALAETALQSGRLGATSGIVTVIRSRRDAHYLAAFRCGPGSCEQVLADALHLGLDHPDLSGARGSIGVGDRPPWWDDACTGAPFLEGCAATAQVIGRIALAIHAAGGGFAPESALPVYVPGDMPWKPLPPMPGGDASPGAAVDPVAR